LLLDEDHDKDCDHDDRYASEREENAPLLKKRRGHYYSYSLQFKNSIVMKLEHILVEISEKYGIPRLTIWSWENQLRMKNNW
jgi:hypothetical protein